MFLYNFNELKMTYNFTLHNLSPPPPLTKFESFFWLFGKINLSFKLYKYSLSETKKKSII